MRGSRRSPGDAAKKTVFGTDGWEVRITDEYKFDVVRACAGGAADHSGRIGYEHRVAPEHFAAAAPGVAFARRSTCSPRIGVCRAGRSEVANAAARARSDNPA